MIAMTLLSAFALLGAQEAPSALPISETATAQSTLQRAGADGAIGVGTPLVWRVTIDDPSFDDPSSDGVSLGKPVLGPEWAVIDGPRDVVDGSVVKSSRPDLVREWTLMPLAGGTFTTPTLTATLDGAAVVAVPSASVEVLPSLGATEEAPRPLLGFREAPDRRVGDPRAAFLVALGLLAALLGWFLWRRGAKRRASMVAAVPPEPSALEQLRSIDPNAGAAGQVMAALAPLFRRAFDAELSAAERQRRSSLTDEAWGAEVEAKATVGADAARLLTELSSYRYGGGEPTSFAVKDALKRATELASSVASSVASAVQRVEQAGNTAKTKDGEEAA